MTKRERVAVTGAGGQLGGYLLSQLDHQGYEVVGLGHSAGRGIDAVVDISDQAAVKDALTHVRPDVVIHGAAYTDVDGCETNPDHAFRVNHLGSRNIADAAGQLGAWVLAVSTDFVFGGDSDTPYTEDAETAPISVYGQSKLLGEHAVLQAESSFAVIRTSWVFGGAGKHFPRTVVSVLKDRGAISVVDDEVSSPTYAGDLARAIVALIPMRPAGVLHLTNAGVVSRYDFAREVAMAAGLDPDAITSTSTAEFLAKYPLPARRPAFSALANQRAAKMGITLPEWQDAVVRYVPRMMAGWNNPQSREQ